MLGSDPIFNGSLSPAAEWDQFFGAFIDPQQVPWLPTGRLHEAPQYYRIFPTWLDDNWEQLLPDDQKPLFVDIWMYRNLIRQFIPEATIAQWVLKTRPKGEYTVPHWRSPQMGQQVPTDMSQDSADGIWNMFWYLTYGTFDAFTPIQFDDQVLDQTQIVTDFQLDNFDSGGGAAGLDEDGNPEPPTYKGWTLSLIHKFFKLGSIDPDTQVQGPPTVNYHAVGAWTLDQDPDYDPYTVWDQRVPTRWNMFVNLLNFPSNYMTLIPWQP